MNFKTIEKAIRENKTLLVAQQEIKQQENEQQQTNEIKGFMFKLNMVCL